MSMERPGGATMKGNPLTLIGPELKVGDTAPDFELLKNDLSSVTLSDFGSKIKLISAVPSLDTSVCDQQARTFNEAAANLGENVVILAVSMDLPFAQGRWCSAAGVDRVITLSDHRDANFGTAYGVLMKGARLLSRAVFVVDGENIVRHVEYVKENATLPDFDTALAVVRSLL